MMKRARYMAVQTGVQWLHDKYNRFIRVLNIVVAVIAG